MAVCTKCGEELDPGQRFCGHCGLERQAEPQQSAPQETTTQRTVRQKAAPQAVYMPPVDEETTSGAQHHSPVMAQAAMGLGIGGGLLGILWGALGPYLSLKAPAHIGWFAGTNPYATGIEPVILLIVGLALGVLAILGAYVATRAIVITRALLVVCGLAGFLVGPSWLVPGALLLTGAGFAMAARPER